MNKELKIIIQEESHEDIVVSLKFEDDESININFNFGDGGLDKNKSEHQKWMATEILEMLKNLE